MALKTKIVVIEGEQSEDNRDGGVTYLVTEMPSDRAEKWAFRALNALAASGIKIPDAGKAAGMAAVAGLAGEAFDGFRGIPFQQAEPLLDEMMACVQIIPDPRTTSEVYPHGRPRAIKQGDIQELSTRVLLRKEVLMLHVSFSMAARFRSFLSAGAPATSGSMDEA